MFWQLGTPVTIVQGIAKLRERNRKSEVMGPPPGNISYVSIQQAQHTHPRLKSRYRDIQHHLDRVDQNQSVFRLPIEICETSSGRFLWSLLNIINMLNPISYSFTIHRKTSAESNENKLTAVHPLSEPFFYHIPTPATSPDLPNQST